MVVGDLLKYFYRINPKFKGSVKSKCLQKRRRRRKSTKEKRRRKTSRPWEAVICFNIRSGKTWYLKQGHVLAVILLALLNVNAATAVDKRAALFGVSISCEHT